MYRKILVFIFSSLLGGCFLLWGPGGVLHPNHQEKSLEIMIPKGHSLLMTAKALAASKAIRFEWGFILAAVLTGKYQQLKAGEYLVEANTTPLDLLNLIVSGKIILRQITIPEGVTVHQAIEIIHQTPHLEGKIKEDVKEGSILPQTYRYQRGDTREKILKNMTDGMRKALEKAWQAFPDKTLVKTPTEFLTLASLVEKETSLPHERPLVARVFLNRLAKGMRLQCDPTTIYGLTKGQKLLGRTLTRKDLESINPYNTYTILGLPPTPIACPGTETLMAVAQPAQSEALYFVANGKGGHFFTESYSDHKKNVQAYREQIKDALS